MVWVLIAAAVWVGVAVVVALLIGRAIRLADRKAFDPGTFVVDVEPVPGTSETVSDGKAHQDPKTIPSIPSTRPPLPPPPHRTSRRTAPRGRREAG